MTMICLDYNILHHVKNNTVYITLNVHCAFILKQKRSLTLTPGILFYDYYVGGIHGSYVVYGGWFC